MLCVCYNMEKGGDFVETEKKEYPVWKLILQIILALMLAFGLFLGVPLLWAANRDARYERMKPQVQELATVYIAEQYPGNDFEITDLYHNFKSNTFDVKIQSRSSADTHFTVKFVDDTLEVDYDSYEWAVLQRGNTRERIIRDYEAQAEAVLNTLPGIDFVRADFVRYSKQTSLEQYSVDLSMDSLSLELDGQYDAAAMGWDHGTLELWFVEKPEDLHIHRLLERLREVDAAMTQAGVGYRLIEITLVDAPDFDYTQKFYIHDILREDLYSEDPLAALQELWEAQEAKRQEMKEKWEKSE